MRLRYPITGWGLLAFACGLGGFAKVNLIGEVYITELALALVLPFALFPRAVGELGRNAHFRLFLGALLVTFAGYVVSDMVRESRPDQYLRGWARLVFMLVDFLAIAALAARDPRNFWWFVVGMGVGGVLYMRLALGLPISIWKFGYSVPFSFVFVGFANLFSLRVAALLLAALGFYSILKDYRIHGLVCLLVAPVMWLRARGGPVAKVTTAQYLRLGVLGAVGAAVAAVALQTTEDQFAGRRDLSDFGRAVGLRVGLMSVAESPIVGWGSWPEHPALKRITSAAIKDEEARRPGTTYWGPDEGIIFHAHSQILQAWMEGGLFGAVFFALFGWLLLRGIHYCSLARPGDPLLPVLLFLFVFQLWHLVQSPIGANQRLHIATAAAGLVLIHRERRAARLAASALAAGALPQRGDRVRQRG